MSTVVVKSKSGTRYAQEITSGVEGTHRLVSDIDKELGGEASGASPHELLMAALGSCTSITVKMYAERKEWPLESVSVKLTEEKISDPQNPSRSIPKFVRELSFTGSLSEEQTDTLKAIADKCPVHKMLSGHNVIETRLAAALESQAQ